MRKFVNVHVGRGGGGGIFNGIAQGQGVNTTSSAQFVILRCFD